MCTRNPICRFRSGISERLSVKAGSTWKTLISSLCRFQACLMSLTDILETRDPSAEETLDPNQIRMMIFQNSNLPVCLFVFVVFSAEYQLLLKRKTVKETLQHSTIQGMCSTSCSSRLSSEVLLKFCCLGSSRMIERIRKVHQSLMVTKVTWMNYPFKNNVQ